ncbi:MAG TPA: hypothetical protein VK149_03130 [Sideroxyarcus sp.]|nr:hypothetical protein [Sideroxyarcus sp.]
MKRAISLLGASLLAATLAVPAQAGGNDRSERGMTRAEDMTGMQDGCIDDAGCMREDCLKGSHDMTGKVSKIDRARGMLVLKHGASDITMQFPAASLKELNNGDTITVHLSFSKETAQ